MTSGRRSQKVSGQYYTRMPFPGRTVPSVLLEEDTVSQKVAVLARVNISVPSDEKPRRARATSFGDSPEDYPEFRLCARLCGHRRNGMRTFRSQGGCREVPSPTRSGNSLLQPRIPRIHRARAARTSAYPFSHYLSHPQLRASPRPTLAPRALRNFPQLQT